MMTNDITLHNSFSYSSPIALIQVAHNDPQRSKQDIIRLRAARTLTLFCGTQSYIGAWCTLIRQYRSHYPNTSPPVYAPIVLCTLVLIILHLMRPVCLAPSGACVLLPCTQALVPSCTFPHKLILYWFIIQVWLTKI